MEREGQKEREKNWRMMSAHEHIILSNEGSQSQYVCYQSEKKVITTLFSLRVRKERRQMNKHFVVVQRSSVHSCSLFYSYCLCSSTSKSCKSAKRKKEMS